MESEPTPTLRQIMTDRISNLSYLDEEFESKKITKDDAGFNRICYMNHLNSLSDEDFVNRFEKLSVLNA